MATLPPLAAALLALAVFPQSEERAAEAQLVLETLAGKLETRSPAAPGEIRFSPSDTTFLRYEGERPDLERSAARVDLSDGQRWTGDVAGGEGDRLRWKTTVGPELALSVDHIACIEFHGRIAAIDRAALEPAPEGDRLYWAHGTALERVDGTFESFSDAGVELDSVLGKRTFPWAEVGALFVAPLDDAPSSKPQSGTPLLVDLADGSRVRGAFASVDANGLVLSYPGLERLLLPLPALIEAALDDGSFVHLSALPPARAEEGSLFGDELGLRWPHRVDQSVVGTALFVGGKSFTRGIGVHAPSRLEWDLARLASSGGAVRELHGSVGIDDSVRRASARGSVQFQVLVDGVARWDSGIVRGGERAKAMPRIDLRGAKQLALIVGVADDSFVADRADWLRLILVRER